MCTLRFFRRENKRLKQENRVQLSFQSVLKIFSIFGVGIGLIGAFFSFLTIGLQGELSAGFAEALLLPVLSPLIFILFAVIGYPFFALVSRCRGGLMLTVSRISREKAN